MVRKKNVCSYERTQRAKIHLGLAKKPQPFLVIWFSNLNVKTETKHRNRNRKWQKQYMKLKVAFCQKIQFGSKKFAKSLSRAEIELSDKKIHLVSSNVSFLFLSIPGNSNFLLRISSDLAHFLELDRALWPKAKICLLDFTNVNFTN